MAPPGRGRGRLGEEPCRCILFSKKIKYFHGKLFLCVPCSSLLLLILSPGLSFGVSSVSYLEPPPQGPLLAACGSGPIWGPDCVEAGTPLRTICAAFTSPSWAEGGSEDGRLAAGPWVSHTGLSASCAFLLSWPSHRSVPQAPDTPGAFLLWLACPSCALPRLCCCPLLLGKISQGRLGSWLPAAPSPHPHSQHPSF